jgi:hypothetical protein
MATTATKIDSVANEVNSGNANTLSNAAQQMKLGTMLTPQKWTIAALASTTAVDITSAAVAAAATPGAFTPALATGERLSAALGCFNVRVTAGAAAAGKREISDSGDTPTATVATLSDDGKTLTFEAGVTGFVLEYLPRSAKDMTTAFAPQS